MTKELVLAIKKAEDAASERILAVRIQAKRLVGESEKSGQKRAAEILAASEKTGAELLEEMRRRAGVECEKIAAAAEIEAAGISRAASEKLSGAVQIIMSKVVE